MVNRFGFDEARRDAEAQAFGHELARRHYGGPRTAAAAAAEDGLERFYDARATYSYVDLHGAMTSVAGRPQLNELMAAGCLPRPATVAVPIRSVRATLRRRPDRDHLLVAVAADGFAQQFVVEIAAGSPTWAVVATVVTEMLTVVDYCPGPRPNRDTAADRAVVKRLFPQPPAETSGPATAAPGRRPPDPVASGRPNGSSVERRRLVRAAVSDRTALTVFCRGVACLIIFIVLKKLLHFHVF